MSASEEFKQRQRKTWSSGDFPEIAKTIQSAADAVVEAAEAGPGVELLDVATGSGNVAIPAAERGATVTGLDLVPELIEAARGRAADAGVEATFVVGDAEALPFADASFDRVTSTFGTMFAPDHERTAEELVRVARPGGRIVVAAWTPEGLNGEMFKTLGAHLPPPPPELRSPLLWGTDDHIRELFSAPGLEVATERRELIASWDGGVEGWVAYCEVALGPTLMAKAALEPQGKWDAARADLIDLYTRHNRATDGSLEAGAEYLLTVVTVPG